MKRVKTVLTSLFAILALAVLSPASAEAQAPAKVPPPPSKPAVDQLGHMENVSHKDRTMLVAFLIIQVVMCVFVAVALMGHLPWFIRKS